MQLCTPPKNEKFSPCDPLKTEKSGSKPWTAKYCLNLCYVPTEPTMWRRRGATWPRREEIKPVNCFLEAGNGGIWLEESVTQWHIMRHTYQADPLPLSSIFFTKWTAYALYARVRKCGRSSSNTSSLSACEQCLTQVYLIKTKSK